jgi:predicted nucleic acid-binding protein
MGKPRGRHERKHMSQSVGSERVSMAMTGLLDTLSAWWPPCRTAPDRILRRIGHHRNGTARVAVADTEDEEKVHEFLSQLVICELTLPIRARAVQLRREQRLRLPDAIVCATAIEFGVELWTNDTSLVKVPGLTCRTARLLSA